MERLQIVTTGIEPYDYVKIIRSGAELAINAQEFLSPEINEITTSSGTLAIAGLYNGSLVPITLGANTTISFPSPGVGCFILKLIQGGSGSYTVTWPSNLKWPGGSAPTLTTTVGAWDIITIIWDGTYFSATSTLNFTV